MNDKIEEVARAISGSGTPSKASYRKARAAIEVMRVPTDAMCQAMIDYAAGGTGDRDADMAGIRRAWGSAIDAILQGWSNGK